MTIDHQIAQQGLRYAQEQFMDAVRRHVLASQDREQARAGSKEQQVKAQKLLVAAQDEVVRCAETVRAMRDMLR